MISVKQYAEDRGITIQAVHQSMKGKTKAPLLEGHVQTIDGVKWLDEEAVEILDKDRRKPPVIYEKEEANATIEQLRQEKEALLLKVAAQADKIATMAEQTAANAQLLAGAEQTRLALEEAKAEQKALAEEYAQGLAKAAQETAEAERAAQEAQELAQAEKKAREAAEAEAAALRAELNRPLTWKERIFGRKV